MKKRYLTVGTRMRALIMAFVMMFGPLITSQTYAEPLLLEDEYAFDAPLGPLPELFFSAINPGYKIDDISNVGEMIEISRRDISDVPLSLAGVTVSYTNSSGVRSVIFEFPENSWISGESSLLRLAGSSGHELASAYYAVKGSSAGISQSAGPLVLMRGEEVLDTVCWNGDDGCERKFKSGSNESLVRDKTTGGWSFVADYAPVYDENSYYVEQKNDEGYGGDVLESQCKDVRFSEILSYYESFRTEQFVEIYNAGAEQVLLDGCRLKYKNKEYPLSGVLKAEEYYTYYPQGFSLTKNPTNYNRLELIDVNGEVTDTLDYPNGQRKGASYMQVGFGADGEELWRVSYAPTPGFPNNYQEFKTCEEGKVINEATGNCVKVTSISEKICDEGYYLNLLTGRCRKIEQVTEKTCKEGYYLNPETGRCRKITENDGANYELKPETYEEKSSFVALNVVIVILGLGLLYLIYEFRHEIRKLFGKVCRLFR